jgi:hypothetical protein
MDWASMEPMDAVRRKQTEADVLKLTWYLLVPQQRLRGPREQYLPWPASIRVASGFVAVCLGH